MAFRSNKRKEFKKSSYYVWFLGAKESKGLRGDEYIVPVLRPAIEREKELEPMKITLQLSYKGMKIVQTVPKKSNKNKTEMIKHFIPHHAITCAYKESEPDEDVVSCILLIFNPLTKCPVHVHTYRCDSAETATKLHNQLQLLISRPENQKKFREIENRLAAKGLIPGLTRRTLNSDGRSTRTDDSSDSGGGHGSDKDLGLGASPTHINTLYDSLAAELREKLTNKNSTPILLPPKDYDTVCRKQGRAINIKNREKQQGNSIGTFGIFPSMKVEYDPAFTSDKDRGDCSGKSSGIGSDEALSSAIQEVSSHPDFESKVIDPETSSEEDDWSDNEVGHNEDRVPIVHQPVPRDEVFVQKSWRRPLPQPNKRPIPTYHFSEVEPDRKEEYQRPEKPVEESRYVMYPDKSTPDKLDNGMRAVYMTREEYERLEKQRAEEQANKKYLQRENSRESSRKFSDSRHDKAPKEDRIYRGHHQKPNEKVLRREASEERPHYVRNKPSTRTPVHYRHTPVERSLSHGPQEHASEDWGRSGYEMRQSNSLHQINAPKYDWNKVAHYEERTRVPNPPLERTLVHSSTIERFPTIHDKYNPHHQSSSQPKNRFPDRNRSPSEIPGLVDPRRKSLNLDHIGEKGYRSSYAEGYSNRPPTNPRYTVTSSRHF